eukprot:scaffold90041_cov20-Tisochrysis_lutea.AAC.3
MCTLFPAPFSLYQGDLRSCPAPSDCASNTDKLFLDNSMQAPFRGRATGTAHGCFCANVSPSA